MPCVNLTQQHVNPLLTGFLSARSATEENRVVREEAGGPAGTYDGRSSSLVMADLLVQKSNR